MARRAADQAWENFLGPKGRPGFCGHAELEMALVELHRVTGDRKPLELARSFIEWRGRGVVPPAGPTPRAYFQDAVPLRQQETLEGHAVRAVFFATGVADIALETGDCDYRLAVGRFWASTAGRRMAFTGSIGPRKEHEAFGEDYELPVDGYYESCAACGLADFAHRMLLLEGQAAAGDVLERVLYNAVLHGVSLDGTTSYYQNPLTDRDNLRYNSWVCCPPNLSRTILQAGRYACAANTREVFLNLFAAGRVDAEAAGLSFEVKTEFPWEERVTLTITAAPTNAVALNLRQPGWCKKLSMQLNGAPLARRPLTDAHWLRLDRSWKAGDVVELRFEMPVRRWEGHPQIKGLAGMVAVQRGPIVYGFEGVDNPDGENIELAADPAWQIERRRDLLGDVVVLRGRRADGRTATAVPFYTLANRGKSWQRVWVKQQGWKPNDAWWEGRLYRAID